jgi:hypothetical protein
MRSSPGQDVTVKVSGAPEPWQPAARGAASARARTAERSHMTRSRALAIGFFVLLLSSAMIAALMRDRRISLTPATRLDPRRPLPGTLNHFSLAFQIEQ